MSLLEAEKFAARSEVAHPSVGGGRKRALARFGLAQRPGMLASRAPLALISLYSFVDKTPYFSTRREDSHSNTRANSCALLPLSDISSRTTLNPHFSKARLADLFFAHTTTVYLALVVVLLAMACSMSF